MLHLIFYSKIASETQEFDIADVLNATCEKLIYRHPHIYGDVTVSGEEEVKQNWEKLKLKEGKKSVLEGVPKGLPSMVKAQRIQDKVSQVGFDWEETHQVVDKIHEELNELSHAVKSNDSVEIENEMGDVLFAVINYARLLNLDAEKALEMTNIKFMKRFQWMERHAAAQNLSIADVNIKEMEKWWQLAKLEE
jgi:XTP/dITP diphosphohydrolase